ncbi:23S ribosomal RNA methyltransferase [Hyphopichia burtonii NRRL Y-1933]|uniref:rRNA methyltransferase 2, mitochondrial n=1 Tax=Hyphopichia burtonii NRRL Y-1933 TaxID=984485 RepID=A0A1E4RFT5_9ASCO|nr:23S ribosomal RNA methyltransferase [Hyphopichia burtonii NRRL Y-1933]ODV66113.1 23S ribosomal RNA methyltransferase [Hyphopichia burtonii NRRL Y-1933]
MITLNTGAGNAFRTILKVSPIRHKSSSSTRWLSRQKTDIYTKQSKNEHFRSRAAYKLIEINDKFRLLNKHCKYVVDLGFAPGAWTQVAVAELIKKRKQKTKILGVDLINCTPPEGSHFIQGDILSKKTHGEIIDFFNETDSHNEKPVDLVLSDMMANTSGIKDNDHYASMDLCDGVLILTCLVLKKNGNLAMKFYTGKEDGILKLRLQKIFKKVYVMKPEACRQELRELYFVCLKKKTDDITIEEVFNNE